MTLRRPLGRSRQVQGPCDMGVGVGVWIMPCKACRIRMRHTWCLQEETWVSWFCSLRGNEFFCEVDEDYIEDDFNLSGLSNQVQVPPSLAAVTPLPCMQTRSGL